MDLVHLESFIRRNVSFEDLPAAVKQKLGHSKKEFEKSVISFSIRNQLRYRGNLVRLIRKDEKKYYDELVDYSKRNLMLYPYHLSDIVVPVLKTTPFQYYVSMLESLMAQEKSYDSLPNFTAADCLRLLGIGRNQYIDLMNSNRSGKKFGFFRKRGVDLLPSQPVDNLAILPWWLVRVGHVTEDDVRAMSKQEHDTIDKVIDLGASAPAAGTFEHAVIKQLHLKGLIYFDVPIEDNDYVVVPPLENFVMNRVLGDFFETLLYKIFVSIDEHTSVGELAAILEVDGEDIRNAVSLYCRLGIAKKKNADMDSNDLHPSWYDAMTLNSSLASNVSPPPAKGPARTVSVSSEDEDDSLLRELAIELEQEKRSDSPASIVMASGGSGQAFKTMLSTSSSMGSSSLVSPNNAGAKKIGFLFDSTLTAYLMMGNLSPGLKTHAVTMFEVGKLSDESLDHLVCELDKVSQGEGEGEAARYFSHAITLRQTILFLRQNCAMEEQDAASSMCLGLDLIRCESLQSLDPSTVSRLLSKNYSLLVSMAPLKYEIRPHLDCFPPHLGPSVAEVSSIWFKLFLYNATGYGPPSLFLPKGFRIKRLPRIFDCCSRLLVTSWAHDPSDIPMSSALTMVMDALQHSPVLVQAYCEVGLTATPSLKSLAFPPTPATEQNHPDSCWWKDTKSLVRLQELVDLEHSCGFITLLKLPTIQHKLRGGHPDPKECHEGQLDTQGAEILAAELDSLCNEPPSDQKPQLDGDQCASGDWILLDVNFGVPLWDPDLNNEVCKRIVSHQLWKPDSLSRLTEANRSLSQRLMDFIHGCQKSSVPWPSQMLAMPMQPLFFDGRQLHYRIPNHA